MASRLALAVAVALTTLLVLEVAARVVEPRTAAVDGASSPYDSVRDPYLGYRLRKSSRFRGVKNVGGETCYDVAYSTDSFGRRMVGTPRDARPARPRLVLFGCSFTFGEGLSDEETLQFRLGRGFDVVNYAVFGYGLQHALAFLREERLHDEVPAGRAPGCTFSTTFTSSARFSPPTTHG